MFSCSPLSLVDGKWSSWETWSPCTKTCGNGMRNRLRLCNNPAPANGGNTCDGKEESSEFCLVRHCPGKSNFHTLGYTVFANLMKIICGDNHPIMIHFDKSEEKIVGSFLECSICIRLNARPFTFVTFSNACPCFFRMWGDRSAQGIKLCGLQRSTTSSICATERITPRSVS